MPDEPDQNKKDTRKPPPGAADVYTAPTVRFDENSDEIRKLLAEARAAEATKGSPAPNQASAPAAVPTPTPQPKEAAAGTYRVVTPRSVPRPTPKVVTPPSPTFDEDGEPITDSIEVKLDE